jgi:hypothetical protein
LDLAIFFGRDKATNTKRLRDIPLGLALPRSFSHFDNLDKNISDKNRTVSQPALSL